jgi:hypothetical protein
MYLALGRVDLLGILGALKFANNGMSVFFLLLTLQYVEKKVFSTFWRSSSVFYSNLNSFKLEFYRVFKHDVVRVN